MSSKSNELTAEPFLNGSSGIYVEQMYESWRRDPSSVHASWAAYFSNVEAGGESCLDSILTFICRKTWAVFSGTTVSSARLCTRCSTTTGRPFSRSNWQCNSCCSWPLEDSTANSFLSGRGFNIYMDVTPLFRPEGIILLTWIHWASILVKSFKKRSVNDSCPRLLLADLDDTIPRELEMDFYGFTDKDLDREFILPPTTFIGGDRATLTLREILDRLKVGNHSSVNFMFLLEHLLSAHRSWVYVRYIGTYCHIV